VSQRRSTVNGEAPRDVLVADPDSSRCGAATTAGALHRTHRLLRPSIVGGPSPQVPTPIALVALARVADASRAHLAGRLGRHWSQAVAAQAWQAVVPAESRSRPSTRRRGAEVVQCVPEQSPNDGD
jgi:hypothetical protein